MSKIDIESAVKTIDDPQPTYEEMMKAVALQLQSTDDLAEELTKRLDGRAGSILAGIDDNDLINELTMRMSNIGLLICQANIFQNMVAPFNIGTHISTGSLNCYNDE